jgi:hypothetical protein
VSDPASEGFSRLGAEEVREEVSGEDREGVSEAVSDPGGEPHAPDMTRMSSAPDRIELRTARLFMRASQDYLPTFRDRLPE